MKSICVIVFCSDLALYSLAAANFQLMEITRNTNAVTLKWNAEASKSYQVQSAGFVAGPWRSRASVDAVTTLANWADTESASLTQQFYRVALITNSSSALSREGLFAGDFIPSNTTLLGEQSGEIGANAVFLASQIGTGGAQLVTTGTLTQLGQNWTYGPSPNDRLVVQFATGTNVSYYITRMQGNFSIDAATFLRQNQNFDYRVVLPNVGDLTFTWEIGSGNPTFRVTALGTLVWSNVTYNINLALVGVYRFEIDSTGSSLLDDYMATGTVSAPGYGMTINERRRFELISTTTGSATSEQTWNNNNLTIGSDVYKWVNAQKQKSFRNGNPSSVDTYWQASGGVLKNGAPFGLYKFDTSSAGLGYVRFTLVLPNEVIELESWRF